MKVDRFTKTVVLLNCIVPVTLLVLRWGLGRPIEKLAGWLGDLRTGRALAGSGPELPEEEVFRPLKREAARLARHRDEWLAGRLDFKRQKARYDRLLARPKLLESLITASRRTGRPGRAGRRPMTGWRARAAGAHKTAARSTP